MMAVDTTCSVGNSNTVTQESGVSPTQSDVLMGRGNSHKNHPGNIVFQGLIKKYRKQYFQVDTLVNKRNTITEIIKQCHNMGARFLEQKTRTDKGAETGKDLEWTVLTKERTFRKVSLAIQYRQRCNASAANNAVASPTVSTPPSKVEPKKLTPCSLPDKLSSSDTIPALNMGRNMTDPCSNPSFNKNEFHAGNEKLGNVICNRDYLQSDKRTTQAMPMTYRSDNNNHKEFGTGYDDSSFWVAQPSTAHSPWSLPFLSHTMSSLPLQPSSIHLRQRPIQYGSMRYSNDISSDKYGDQYYTDPLQRNSSNLNHLVVPGVYQTRQQQQQEPRYQRQTIPKDLYLSEDYGEDPVPLSEVFHSQENYHNATMNRMNQQSQNNWYRSSMNQRSSLSTNTMSSDPSRQHQQNLCTPDVSPKHQQQQLEEQQLHLNQEVIRRVSNFDEPNNQIRNKKDGHKLSSLSSVSSTIATDQSGGVDGVYDEVISAACSITIGTTDVMKQFHSDNITSAESCIDRSVSTDVADDNHHHPDTISIGGDSDRHDDDDNLHHVSSNSDIYSCCTSSNSSILHNDLCLSPFFESDHSPYDTMIDHNEMIHDHDNVSYANRSSIWI